MGRLEANATVAKVLEGGQHCPGTAYNDKGV